MDFSNTSWIGLKLIFLLAVGEILGWDYWKNFAFIFAMVGLELLDMWRMDDFKIHAKLDKLIELKEKELKR